MISGEPFWFLFSGFCGNLVSQEYDFCPKKGSFLVSDRNGEFLMVTYNLGKNKMIYPSGSYPIL